MRYLSIRLTGRERALHAYLKDHPAELRGTRRDGEMLTVSILVSDKMLEVIPRFGLHFEVLYDATEMGRLRRQEVGLGNRFDLGGPEPITTLALVSAATTKYLNVPEVEAATIAIAAAYPQLCELHELPEKTFENRTCNAIWIGKQAPAQAPTIVILGGVHGLEWGSCEIALNFVDQLLDAYTNGTNLVFGGATFPAADIAQLLQTRQIVVFPLVNPDGRAYSQLLLGDPLWRKNRNASNSRGDPFRVGIDVNRNFDFCFDVPTKFDPNATLLVSRDPLDHDLYQGPNAFSEAESLNVKSLLDDFQSTGWLVDLHSCSQTIITAWGDDETQETKKKEWFGNPRFDGKRGLAGGYAEYMPPGDVIETDRLVSVLTGSIASVAGTAYTPVTGFGAAFPTPGTSHDYAYSRHFVDPSKSKVLGFAVEWGLDVHPPWIEMKVIVGEVTAGLVGFCIAT